MSKYNIPIEHPEWLEHSSPEKTIALIRKGMVPNSIGGWMLVVSLKHPLRAVYGSDMKAAFALLWLAIRGKWDNAIGLHIWLWRASRLFLKKERDYWLAQGLTDEDMADPPDQTGEER